MALSYDEMQQLFEQKGFKGFSVRPYDAEIENLISEAAEDNAKAYMIDIVPGNLEFGQNDGLPCWKSIIIKRLIWLVCFESGWTLFSIFMLLSAGDCSGYWRRRTDHRRFQMNKHPMKKDISWKSQWNPSMTWMSF